jgi:hypothetical protein
MIAINCAALPFFVGFDITLMGGLSWGNWGWEVGQKIAEEC